MKANIKQLKYIAIKDYVLSQAIGMLMLIAVNAMGAVLIVNETIEWNAEGYITMISTLAAAYTSTSLLLVKWKNNRLIACGISACGLFGILLIVNAFAMGFVYGGVGVTALIILCGSVLAILHKKKGRARGIKFKY